MAKIFISFYNAVQDDDNPLAMPCFYDSLIHELKNNGNQVLVFFSSDYYPFSWSFKEAEIKVDLSATIKKLRDFDPDFIIAFNHSYLDISNYFECPIVIWEVDSYQMYADKDIIHKNPDRYVFFAASTKTRQETMNLFKTRNVHYVPFTTAVKSENKEKKINISFIGTYFGCEQLANVFMRQNPSDEEIRQFKQLLVCLAEKPEQKLDEALAALAIESEKIHGLAVSNYQYLQYISMNRRLGVLSEIADLGLKIYGSKTWIEQPVNDPNLVLSYTPETVYSLEHNQNIYNSSKIAVNINHIQAGSGFSWRVADVMASSSCLVSDPRGDFKLLFPGIDFFTYENRYEAREVCKKLLDENNLRFDYSKKCNEVIDKNYRIRHTLEKIEEILDIKLADLESAGSVKKFTAVEFSNAKRRLNIMTGKATRTLRKIFRLN
jgi:hypothetical protein